jgi:hypothetical protein
MPSKTPFKSFPQNLHDKILAYLQEFIMVGQPKFSDKLKGFWLNIVQHSPVLRHGEVPPQQSASYVFIYLTGVGTNGPSTYGSFAARICST